MSKDNEEKQLLEDASTLLMFANVAARHQSPSSPQQTKPQIQPHPAPPATLPLNSISTDAKPLYSQTQTPAVLPPLGTAPRPSFAPQQEAPPQSAGLPQVSSAHSHLQSPGGLPQIIPGYPYYPYGYGANGHGQLPSRTGVPLAPSVLLLSPPLMQPFSPLVAHKEPPATDPEPQDKEPRRMLASTTLQPSLSGLGSLPAQGKFQTHNRTPSGGFYPELASPHVGSPGPASVALNRGINVETGKRNNNNAVIAAAALAAAAENPLPLKSIELIPKQLPKQEPAVSDSALTEPEEDLNKTDDEQPADLEPVSQPQSSNPEAVDRPSTPQTPAMATVKLPSVKSPLTQDSERKEVLVKKEPSPVATPPSNESVDQSSQPNEYNVPPLESYKVHPDSGVIGCICGIEEDDGFTIQCDVCYRWQHCMCMGYKTNEEVPEDEYKCYYCDESKHNKFDSLSCRNDTLQRLDMEKATNDLPEKPAAAKRKTLSSGNDDKKRRKSDKDVRTATTDRPSADKRKPSKSNGVVPSASVQSAAVKICNKENSQLEDGVTAESYQGVYFKLTANDYKTPQVKQALTNFGISFELTNNAVSEIQSVSLSDFQALKFSKIILPNYQQHLQEKNEIGRKVKYNETCIQVKPYSDNPKQRYVGVPKIGVFISDRMGQSEQEITIPTGTPIIEYLGEVDYFELYATHKVNQYNSWGTLKPKVAKVDLLSGTVSASFVLDSRFVGNETRFIRKSCIHTSNCEIKPIYIPELKAFKFVVYTSKPILLKGENMEEELRLPWQWDINHPIRKMIKETNDGEYEEGDKFEDFTDEEKVLLVSGVDKILNFVECACNTTSMSLMCLIFKVKKATSYLLRSTRKASSLSNSAFNKSKEELVMPKKDRKFISWKERLIERDQAIKLAMSSEHSIEDGEIVGEGTSIGMFESTNDGNTSSISIIDHSVPSFPFQRSVFAQGRRYASRSFRFESGTPENVDEAKMALTVPKIIAVPLVSDILSTIKDTVKSKLQPTISTGIPLFAKKEQAPASISSLSQKDVPPAPLKLNEESTIASKPKPPQTVKKLSFADYKKKMK